MDKFLKIQNNSDSKWSYVCISMFGKTAGDPATSNGTLDIGKLITNYEREEYVFPGTVYFCHGTYPPEHCINHFNLKRDYCAIHKRTFRITGDTDTGYKLESDGDTSEYFVPRTEQQQSEQHAEGQSQGNCRRSEHQQSQRSTLNGHRPESDGNLDEQPHEKALRDWSVELCNKMENTEVVIYLFSKGCMTYVKKEEIESEIQRFKLNDRLVTWLRNQPIETFKLFCDALDVSNQEHLSKPLRDYLQMR